MDFNEYQALARRTQNQELSIGELERHALHGLVSEVGEIHSPYQKTYQGHGLKYDHIVDEMGDLLWFMAELADAIGTTLEDIASRNIDKLKKRYPDGFDVDHSVNREEYR